MKQTDPQYKLRLPQQLKDQIESAANTSGRSMNAEIVHRLEQSFTRRHVSGVSVGGPIPGSTLLTSTPEELAELIAEKLKSQK
jgi:hypothetical protein